MLRKRISTARLHGIVIALIVGSLVSSVLGQTLGYALGQHIEASAGGASVGGIEHNAGALDGAHGGQTKKQPSVPRPITVPVLQGQQDDARHGERRHGDDGDDGDAWLHSGHGDQRHGDSNRQDNDKGQQGDD